MLGDSPWSYYKFNYGTALDPAIRWVKYHTNGMSCPQPGSRASASAGTRPITFVWQGTRPVMANLQGNVVEAYPPGGAPRSASGPTSLRGGRGHTDRRRAEPASTSAPRAPTCGGASDSPTRTSACGPSARARASRRRAAHVGEGRYAAPMTLAPEPRLNTVEVAGKHYAPLVKYVGATGGDVDPATVDPSTLALTRVKDPARPIQIVDSFSVWGVLPEITKLEPSPVFLSAGGLVTRASTVTHEIAPPEYGSLLAPNDLRFEVRAAADDRVVLAANGGGASTLQDPRRPLARVRGVQRAARRPRASRAAGRTCPRPSSRSRSAPRSTS